jgi:hypothetical protein
VQVVPLHDQIAGVGRAAGQLGHRLQQSEGHAPMMLDDGFFADPVQSSELACGSSDARSVVRTASEVGAGRRIVSRYHNSAACLLGIHGASKGRFTRPRGPRETSRESRPPYGIWRRRVGTRRARCVATVSQAVNL